MKFAHTEKKNQTIRSARYGFFIRILRLLFANRSALFFLASYSLLTLCALSAEATISPDSLPDWTSTSLKDLLESSAGYLIAAQAGILGIVSVAVGLVTLITQKADSSSTNTDIRLYYSESLAYEVISSSIALLIVLLIQTFWPFQFLLHLAGLGSRNLTFKVILTSFHCLWLCINVAAFGHFLSSSLRFVEPKSRERMRERFTANLVIPIDLNIRLHRTLFEVLGKQIYENSRVNDVDDGGISVSLASFLPENGIEEISAKFRRDKVLVDIRAIPLTFAINSWVRRISPGQDQDRKVYREKRRRPTASLVLPQSFDSGRQDSKIICIREGGPPLTNIEKWAIRRSFTFKFSNHTKHLDLPNPSDFMEELADKVIGQIDRLAITGFNAALDEMIRYRSFIVAAYQSEGAGKRSLNLAELGGVFTSPLRDWESHYRRVIERAVEKLVDDPELANSLGRVPNRLLRKKPPNVSSAVENSFLGIGPVFVVMLEQWVSRRRVGQSANAAAAQTTIKLTGTDRRAYSAILLDFSGNWESLVRYGGGHINLSPPASIDAEHQWRSLTDSWPFLLQHLRNTAFYHSLAVWNDDEIGESRFRDNLLRWLDLLPNSDDIDHYLPRKTLLTFKVFDLDWVSLQSRLQLYATEFLFQRVTPRSLFATILAGTLGDVILVTVAVSLGWYISLPNSYELFGDAALALMRREILTEDGSRRSDLMAHPVNTFQWLISLIVRAEIGDEDCIGSYQNFLDGLAILLKQTSERRMVTGRIYSSSGWRGFDDLRVPLLVLLLVNLPSHSDDSIVETISKWTEQESFFSDGDKTLRRLISSFSVMRNLLSDVTVAGQIQRGTSKADPDLHLPSAKILLNDIFQKTIERIENQRKKRLRERAVSDEKIETFRVAFETAIDRIPRRLFPFQDIAYEKVHGSRGDSPEIRLGQIDKGELVDPPMAWASSDLPSMFGRHLVDIMCNEVWSEFFLNRKRNIIRLPSAGYPNQFWTDILNSAQNSQEKSFLIVPYSPIGRDLTSRFSGTDGGFLEGAVMRRTLDKRSEGILEYLGTIGTLDIYSSQYTRRDRIFLSPVRSLEKIKLFIEASEDGNMWVLFDETNNPRAGSLLIYIQQKLDWKSTLGIEFALPSALVERYCRIPKSRFINGPRIKNIRKTRRSTPPK